MGQDYFKKMVDKSMQVGDYNLLKALYVMHSRDVKSDDVFKPEEKFVEVKERIIDDYIRLINYYLENNRTNEDDEKYRVYKCIVKSQLDAIVEEYIEKHRRQLALEN